VAGKIGPTGSAGRNGEVLTRDRGKDRIITDWEKKGKKKRKCRSSKNRRKNGVQLKKEKDKGKVIYNERKYDEKRQSWDQIMKIFKKKHQQAFYIIIIYPQSLNTNYYHY